MLVPMVQGRLLGHIWFGSTNSKCITVADIPLQDKHCSHAQLGV